MYKPTDGMAEEARRALEWRKEGHRGGTAVGLARARQLVNKQNLSEKTVKRMYSFFSRHEVDKQAEGFSPGEEGYPSPGRVAWGLWGGDAGFSWSRAKVAQMEGKMQLGILTTKVKSVTDSGDYITIRGMASTKEVDRVGDIMDPECWQKGGLANYMKNPIILFNHDYNKPIGRGTEVRVTDDGLELTAKISKADGYISKLIQDGVLSTFSVGFKVRDADYVKETGGLYIKDAELYEVSVVSVPANQSATFEIVKCFSPNEFELYKSGLAPLGEVETAVSERKINMNEEELKALVAKQTAAAVKMAMAEKEVADKKATEEKAAKEAEEKKLAEVKAEVAVAKSGTEKLLEEVKATFEANREATQGEIETLKAALKDRGEEVKALQSSKRQFIANGTNDWKKAHEGELRDAYLLGRITGKGWNSDFAKEVINKVSDFSGVEIPAAASVAIFETIAATSIERDIQNELILATLFREIPMTSAAMALPILPDAGYAEFISTKNVTNTGGDAPHGNLDERSDTAGSPYEGIDLGSKTLTTKKLVSLTFLANETEEDAILPILPLLNESMVRAHSRAVERAMLRGSSSIGSFDGLTTLATTNSDVVANTTAFASDALTSDHLLGLRKAMGKYGVRPSEVVYVVSERAYFELLEDPEFKDVSLVGQTATKLRGEIGNVYGSRVVLCDEFVTPAVNAFFALAVNPRNFVVPRLRGVTLESQYVPRLQHRELIATQRLGFDEIIAGATAVTARKYHSA